MYVIGTYLQNLDHMIWFKVTKEDKYNIIINFNKKKRIWKAEKPTEETQQIVFLIYWLIIYHVIENVKNHCSGS